MQASGRFEVEMEGEPPYHEVDGVTLSRVTVHKRFEGPLTARGTVHMLAARTPTEGSAGYVALEHVEGTLDGRDGSFALVHQGLMDRGAQSLAIQIVPDSGCGALTGIAGTMQIRIEDGQHFYDLDYTLAE